MSFIRVAQPLRAHARHQLRRYATPSETLTKPSSKLPAILLGTGVAGLAGYLYLDSKPEALAIGKQESSPLKPDQFVDFKLKKVVPYNHNTSTFIFELPNNEASLIPVTSCLVVKSSDPEALKGPNGKPVIRPYTPVSSPDTKGELALLVKKYDQGLASKHIHELKVGDTLAIKGPIEKFPYKINEFQEVALIGGGSGITPLYQLLTHALSSPKNTTKFTLISANISEADILLREEFDALKKKYPTKFNIIYTLDKPSSASWDGATGYVNAELVQKHVAPPSLGEKVKVFICGPPGQVAALAGKKEGMKQGALGGTLKELGYTEDQVYKF